MLHSGSSVDEHVCVESYMDSVIPNSAFHAVLEAFLTLLWKQLTNCYHGNRDAPTQRSTDGMSSTNSCDTCGIVHCDPGELTGFPPTGMSGQGGGCKMKCCHISHTTCSGDSPTAALSLKMNVVVE